MVTKKLREKWEAEMRLTALASAFCVAGLAGLGGVSSASAQALACGQSYTVKAGDTLQRLTNRAYGPGKSYNLMYRPNSGVIGSNPSAIEIGMVLQVPCRDGAQPTVATARPAVETPAARPRNATLVNAPERSTARDKIRFVTADDFAPFTDRSLPEGGMVTELLDTALKRVLTTDEYQIDFINDWDAQFSPLVSDGHYEFTFPWYRPNCDVSEKLGENSQFRCNNLAWSDPIFEQIISYYVRADGTSDFKSHSDLFGSTICRPVGWATFMLEEKDLSPPRVIMLTPDSPADCFEALLEGRADVVPMASITAEDAISKLQIANLVSEIPQLATVVHLHAAASIDNPQKEELLTVLNEGIRQIRNDGKWFEIVQRHLINHARSTVSN
jgi:polar amino acid transport system substrate-binding protein